MARASDGLKCKKAIDAAMAYIENLLETFSALLRIAQIEAGTRRVGFGQVKVSSLLAHLAETYTAAAEQEGKSITLNIAPKVHTWGTGPTHRNVFQSSRQCPPPYSTRHQH
jgi:thiamine biosynthesis lipoprotein ApbE